jgi:hypothetical protein
MRADFYISVDPTNAPGIAAPVGSVATNGTSTWDKIASGDTDWLVRGLSREESLRRRAGQLLHASSLNMAWFFEDFERGPGSPWVVAAAGGSVDSLSGYTGGVIRILTGAGAGTEQAIAIGTNTGTYPQFFPATTNANWYMVARVVTSNLAALTANSVGGWISRDYSTGAYQIILGFNGSVSTTNWSLKCGTGSLDSGTAIVQGTFAVIEAYRYSGTTYLRVNDGAWVTGANVFPNVGGTPWIALNNAVDGGTQNLIFDYVGGATIVA